MSKGVGTRDYGHHGQVATTAPERPAPGKHTVAESQEAASGAARRTLIVDDASNVPGAMAKEAFLARLRQAVTAETDNAMGAEGASAECPYVEQYFARYASEPAATVEALIFKWVPFAQNSRSAEGLIPLVSARVRSGVAAWRASGTLPADLAAADPAFAAQAQAASNPAGAMTIDSLEAQLGDGRPVDTSTAARMGSVVGADVSAARIHEGPQAAALASQHAATAFAVGPNVVLGANAPQAGTLEYDALLAHELAHTAQQKDAAANPAERRKPIGAEDAAAEHDAGAERLARLGNFAGQVGDVMRTGLQLQRCPNTQKMPPGPPMAGKEADAAIASIPMIRQRIGDDLAKGINAENRTKFHNTMDTYVKAWKEESLMIPAIWKPNLSAAQLEKLRWEAAREQAATAPGFTNFQTDVIHIYTPGTPAFVTIHELIHLHTQNQVYSTMGENFVEGAADYFTKMACIKHNPKIEFVAVYSDQMAAVDDLAAAISDDELAGLVFKGDEKSVEQIVDSKGNGTWKKYKAALAAENTRTQRTCSPVYMKPTPTASRRKTQPLTRNRRPTKHKVAKRRAARSTRNARTGRQRGLSLCQAELSKSTPPIPNRTRPFRVVASTVCARDGRRALSS